MGNDLRERLEALKEDSEQTCLSECEREFRMELAIAFRSGDLFTRSEMQEAVAKAVAAEREACANLMGDVTKPTLPPFSLSSRESDAFDDGQEAAYKAFIRKIRARSEQKEGE